MTAESNDRRKYKSKPKTTTTTTTASVAVVILGVVILVSLFQLRQEIVLLTISLPRWYTSSLGESLRSGSIAPSSESIEMAVAVTTANETVDNMAIRSQTATTSNSVSSSGSYGSSLSELKVGENSSRDGLNLRQEKNDVTSDLPETVVADSSSTSSNNQITTPSSSSSSSLSHTNSSSSEEVNSTVDTSTIQNEASPPLLDYDARPQVPISVYYKGIAGLGHRLARQAASFHFAKALHVSSLEVDWGWCLSSSSNGSNDTSHIVIFEALFGANSSLPVSSSSSSSSSSSVPQVNLPYIKDVQWNWTQLVERVEAAGARSTATNTSSSSSSSSTEHDLPVLNFRFLNEPEYYTHRDVVVHKIKNQIPQFYGKDQSDEEMFDLLRKRFRYMDRVRSFQQRHSFSNHTVLGLHLRLGNGEKTDFARKKRGIPSSIDQKEWLSNLGQLIVTFWADYLRSSPISDGRPPLVFISTDSADPVGVATDLRAGIERASANMTDNEITLIDIPIVTMPQSLIPEGEGVSYAFPHETKEQCIESWVSQFCDMVLLTESDVVLAGLYSSFTQTMPLSYHLGKKDRKRPGKICNVGLTATVLECFDDYLSWFQQGEREVEAYRLPKTTRMIFGEMTGMLQSFSHSGRPMMPIHNLKLQNELRHKLKDYPVAVIPSQ